MQRGRYGFVGVLATVYHVLPTTVHKSSRDTFFGLRFTSSVVGPIGWICLYSTTSSQISYAVQLVANRIHVIYLHPTGSRHVPATRR